MIIIYKLSGTADYSPSQVIETDFLFFVLNKHMYIEQTCLRDVSIHQSMGENPNKSKGERNG